MSQSPTTMRFTPLDAGPGARLQLAPLVDIVFLLISFFMLTSQLIQAQKDRAVELPVMKSPEGERELPAEVTINLREDGRLTVDGEGIAPEGLGGVLAGHVARAREAGETPRVVVRADRRQRFAKLDDVLNVCRQLGLGQVIFRAQGED